MRVRVCTVQRLSLCVWHLHPCTRGRFFYDGVSVWQCVYACVGNEKGVSCDWTFTLVLHWDSTH
jgi:hypothetical protein